MIGPRRTPLTVVVVIILFDHHADYRALAQQIEVPNRVRTSSNVFQDSVDFKVRKSHWSKLTLIPFLIWRTFDHSRRWEMIKEF